MSNRYTAIVQTRSSLSCRTHRVHTNTTLKPASNYLLEVVYKLVCERVPKSVQHIYTWGFQAGSAETGLGTGLNPTCKCSSILTEYQSPGLICLSSLTRKSYQGDDYQVGRIKNQLLVHIHPLNAKCMHLGLPFQGGNNVVHVH